MVRVGQWRNSIVASPKRDQAQSLGQLEPTTTWVKLYNEEIEHKLEYKGCKWLSNIFLLKSPRNTKLE